MYSFKKYCIYLNIYWKLTYKPLGSTWFRKDNLYDKGYFGYSEDAAEPVPFPFRFLLLKVSFNLRQRFLQSSTEM